MCSLTLANHKRQSFHLKFKNAWDRNSRLKKIGGNRMKKIFRRFVILAFGIAAAMAGSAGAENLTKPQKNAVRAAKEYLSIQGFSRDGLISQLSSAAGNGFELRDATIAVDSLGVDWNEQAAKSAKAYLDLMGFSCSGLIQQLSSSAGDKYTKSQATYGAKKAGAC